MLLQGEHVIQASRDRVWELLNDPAVLARCTPGVTSLEPDGEGRYKATIALAIGPIKGSFSGQIAVTDQTPPEAMTLDVKARGPGGGVTAVGRFRLHEIEGGRTRIEWSGQPQLTGVLAAVGGRLLEGAAKPMANQFFEQLAREAAVA
jgi:carbon monoxide dehydrogenase subunit G